MSLSLTGAMGLSINRGTSGPRRAISSLLTFASEALNDGDRADAILGANTRADIENIANYSTTEDGSTITGVTLTILADGVAVADDFITTNGETVTYEVVITQSVGDPRTIARSSTVTFVAPIAGTFAVISDDVGQGVVTVNLAAGFSGDPVETYTVDGVAVAGTTYDVADAVFIGDLDVIATNSGGDSDPVTLTVNRRFPVATASATALPDISATQGDTIAAIDRTTLFDGVRPGATWTVTGNGVSFSGDNIVFDATAPISSNTITVEVENADPRRGPTERTFTYAVAAGVANTLTVDGVTLTFNQSIVGGVSKDGIGWFESAPGLEITANSIAPATVGGDAINGAMLNPELVDGDMVQGWDERAGGYDATLAVDFTSNVPVSAGDILWQAIGDPVTVEDPNTNDERDGWVQKYVQFQCVTTAWNPEHIAPCGIKWAGKTEENAWPFNLTTFLASLSSRLPTAAFLDLQYIDLPPVAEVIAQVGPLQPWGYTQKNSGTEGYETIAIQQFGNYGETRAKWIYCAIYYCLSTQVTTSQREQLALALIRNGVQSHDAFKGAVLPIRSEGGHWQHKTPLAVFMLDALNRSSEIALIETVLGCNPLNQSVIADQAFIDSLQPHTNTALPHTSRIRTINFIGGTGLDELDTGFDYFRDASLGDPARVLWDELEAVRTTDGAFSRITQVDDDIRGGGWKRPDNEVGPNHVVQPLRFQQQVSPPWAANDPIWLRSPYPLKVGDPYWTIDREFPLNYGPSPDTPYMNVNMLTGLALFTGLLGILPDTPGWNAMRLLTVYRNAPSTPALDFDYPVAHMRVLIGEGDVNYRPDQGMWANFSGAAGLTPPLVPLSNPIQLNGAFFASPTDPLPDTTRVIATVRFRLLTTPVTNDQLFGQRSAGGDRFNAAGEAGLSALEDGAGNSVTYNDTLVDGLALGIPHTRTIDIDYLNGVATITLNGAITHEIDLTIPASAQFFQTDQEWLFASLNGAIAALPADTEFDLLRLQTTVNGVQSTPFNIDTQEDTIATIDAHPWKVTTNTITGGQATINDIDPPIFTPSKIEATGEDAGQITGQLSEAGSGRFVIKTTEVAPTAAEMDAGQLENFPVSYINQTILFTTLTDDTTYFIYGRFEDEEATANVGAIELIGSFRTDAAIASPSGPVYARKTSDALTFLQGPDVGAGVSSLTVAIDLNIAISGSSTVEIFEVQSNNFRFLVAADTEPETELKMSMESNSLGLFANSSSGVGGQWSSNTNHTFVMSGTLDDGSDQATGRLFVDGTEVHSETVAAATLITDRVFESQRNYEAFRSALPGDVARIRVWANSYTTDGSAAALDALPAPLFDIGGQDIIDDTLPAGWAKEGANWTAAT